LGPEGAPSLSLLLLEGQGGDSSIRLNKGV
jgi:hypothetical protein